MKSKKRITLLAVLVCVFALVLSLGIFSACGNDGENGGTATAGGSYLYGTTAPDEGLGNAGDYYLDTETLSAYVKTADGEWVQTALYSGTGAPDANEGTQGDLYLDTTGGVLYQKGESLWSIVLKVKGRDGVVWFSGTEEDPNKLNGGTLLQGAMKGDFYLDTTNFVVWQLGEDGQWNWLGSIKGDKGDDSVHVFYGTGAPDGNGAVKGAVKGDLYFGTFDGLEVDDEGAGTVLYRYNEDGTWEELMSDRKKGQINIRTAEQLKKFAESVTAENSYKDREVHLKANIDLSEALAKVSVFETIENTWTPIGTSAAPFEGTFDGEGFTISGFKSEGASAGLFGATKNAAIKNVTIAGATVTATEASGSAGILVAEAQGSLMLSGIKVENSIIKADENAEGAKVGGLVGKAAGTITVQEVDVEVEGVKTEESGNEGNSLVGEGEVDFKGENDIIYDLAEGFVEKHHKKGDGTTEVSCEISSEIGLRAFAKRVGSKKPDGFLRDFKDITVVLTKDVDLEGQWETIGLEEKESEGPSYHSFRGTFDGQGHTIKGITSALFAALGNGAVIQNLTLGEEGTDYVLENSGVAWVYCAPSKGNITFNNCVNNINVKAALYGSGGRACAFLVGTTSTSVVIMNACVNNGKLFCDPDSPMTGGNGNHAAAFVGYVQGSRVELHHCINNGDIDVASSMDGRHNIGGLVSTFQNGSGHILENCENHGNITGCMMLEGTADKHNAANVGGLVGRINDFQVTITNCVNTGNVTAKAGLDLQYADGYAGGFIGYRDSGSSDKITITNGEILGKTTEARETANPPKITAIPASQGNGYTGALIGGLDKGGTVKASGLAMDVELSHFCEKSHGLYGNENATGKIDIQSSTLKITYAEGDTQNFSWDDQGNVGINSHLKIDLNTDNIECAGGIAGYAAGPISDCYAELTVSNPGSWTMRRSSGNSPRSPRDRAGKF